ncbi:MAG TPA: hypothetical protein VGO19_05695 [Actinomycetes bacterium]
MRRPRRPVAVGLLLVLAALLPVGCAGGSGADSGSAGASAPRLSAAVVQLRRDEALGRVEVYVTNRSAGTVTIETVDLSVDAFSGAGPQRKDEPLPAGQGVDLPTGYGEVSCPADGPVQVGVPKVVVAVHREGESRSHRVTLTARGRPLLQRIATGLCLTQKLDSEVSLAFGPQWQRSGHGTATTLRGTLVARLLSDQPRDVTQMAGTVIYDLDPVRSANVLAHLTPAARVARIPVIVSLARCDGHARGEVKQPYAFLVWLARPGGPQQAVTPTVTDADKAAFRAVCPF